MATSAERKAARNQKTIASVNATSTKDLLKNQLAAYDMADAQNRRLADVQRIQNSRKTEADRFLAQKDLQSAALGLLGSFNQAGNSSSIGNFMDMLDRRNDTDNVTYWNQHQQNQNAVENAYDEAKNQNQVARRDAISNAQWSLEAQEADLAANLNNINPDLFVTPGSGDANLGTTGYSNPSKNNARLSGYLMPESSGAKAAKVSEPNKMQGGSYYDRLMNNFTGRG